MGPGAARTNAYSPARLARAADALLDELHKRGYAEAEVKTETKINEADGKVIVHINVKEGPHWQVSEVRYQRDNGDRVELPAVAGWVGKPWSSTVLENVREGVRQAYYHTGHPDVGVHVDSARECR